MMSTKRTTMIASALLLALLAAERPAGARGFGGGGGFARGGGGFGGGGFRGGGFGGGGYRGGGFEGGGYPRWRLMAVTAAGTEAGRISGGAGGGYGGGRIKPGGGWTTASGAAIARRSASSTTAPTAEISSGSATGTPGSTVRLTAATAVNFTNNNRYEHRCQYREHQRINNGGNINRVNNVNVNGSRWGNPYSAYHQGWVHGYWNGAQLERLGLEGWLLGRRRLGIWWRVLGWDGGSRPGATVRRSITGGTCPITTRTNGRLARGRAAAGRGERFSRSPITTRSRSTRRVRPPRHR